MSRKYGFEDLLPVISEDKCEGLEKFKGLYALDTEGK